MFSEPVRRKAMIAARDSGRAALSGKVLLMQETDEDIQAGALMYVPAYRPGMPINTIEERRAAIKGWVYSPYRINDLTHGILGNWDLPGKNRIHLRIYDEDYFTEEALLFDSQAGEEESGKVRPNISATIPVTFNDKIWTMVFTRKSEELTFFNSNLVIVSVSGLLISLLLFFLASALINTRYRATQIRLLNIQLEKLNADKSRFISILGHDLKNPFNTILGFLDILNKDIHILDKGQVNTYLSYVNDVAKNTYGLLTDLLQWISAQSGKIPFEPQLYRFKDIWLHISKGLTPSANAKNIKIDYQGAEEVEVFADIEMFKSIMRNLVINAIKFTGNGGTISIDAETGHDLTTISVTDNGTGIEPGNLDRLFDISHNISTRGTEKESGSGLGLIICREFVTKHGGRIWVESEKGKGSRFIFTIPTGTNEETVQDLNAGEPEFKPAITKVRYPRND
jgi:signal transduction histidine kinase